MVEHQAGLEPVLRPRGAVVGPGVLLGPVVLVGPVVGVADVAENGSRHPREEQSSVARVLPDDPEVGGRTRRRAGQGLGDRVARATIGEAHGRGEAGPAVG